MASRDRGARAVRALLSGVWSAQEIDKRLEQAVVRQMADGDMGSFQFVDAGSEKHQFGRQVAAADYVDDDGILVDISVNVDEQGNLYDIDFCKVDFSPLWKYPGPGDLKTRDLATPTIQAAIAS